jgi:hypothetical protein
MRGVGKRQAAESGGGSHRSHGARYHDFSELDISAFDAVAHVITMTFSIGNDVVVRSEFAPAAQDFLFA